MPVGVFITVLAFQPAHFTQYIIAYSVGLMISKNGWLDELCNRSYEKVLWLVIPTLFMMFGVVGYCFKCWSDNICIWRG